MIDKYCAHYAEGREVQMNVSEWNTLQAILRRASRALEKGFLVVQTTVLVMMLLGMSNLLLLGGQQDFSHFWWESSMGMLALSAALGFFKAAEVTESCARVPSLINSYTFGRNIDKSRHYLIEYVTYSAAGFYVGEVRLTAAMALKLTYIAGLLIFGVLTKVSNE
jgi:hypothetical protein